MERSWADRLRTLALGASVKCVQHLPKKRGFAERFGRVIAPSTGEVWGTIDSYRFPFDLRHSDHLLMAFGLFDAPLTRQLSKMISSGGTLYDVGANVGYFSLLAASRVGSAGEVHAFEPVPANSARLQRALQANQITNVVLNRKAVSEGIGTLQLYIPGESGQETTSTASIADAPDRQRKISVESLSLDSYVYDQGNRPPTIVKIDVEGAEPLVLKGMRRLLDEAKSDHIAIEVNEGMLARLGWSPADVTGPLLEADYAIYMVRSHGLEPYDAAGQRRGVYNLWAYSPKSV